jgi:microcystin-dependent protein
MIRYNAANARWELLNPVASSFTTGDVKSTLKTTADAGWIMMNDGTIGDASSGATTRANADTQALFALLWANVSNTNCPVSGGRGASAAADFAAHKTITLPKLRGRALAAAGAGAGLTSRALGDTVGEETHVLTVPEMPSHQHGIGVHLRGSNGTIGGSFLMADSSPDDLTEPAGGGGAHNNMQPTSFLNFMIKL